MQPMNISRDSDGDRISGLPEDVLLHILSFVTTHQAVQMSLLSKRWRHLWASIPVLCFNEYEFRELHPDKSTAFHDFTDHVLSLRREDESIRKFHFNTSKDVDRSRVRRWLIDVARHRNVEELVIDTNNFHEYIETELGHRPPEGTKLPHCLSSCQTLQVLKLKFWFRCALILPNELKLSGLKSLHLRAITFEGDSLGKLISSCHSLEDLCLERCQFYSLIISGNNLKKLRILFCGERTESKIKVALPSLLSFVYIPLFKQHCSLDNLVSLVEAHIIIFYLDCLSEGMITMCEIIKGIRYASSVLLAYFGDEHLCLQQEQVECLPIFSNLTRLELYTSLHKDVLEAIINILERSPNLKTLILRMCEPEPNEEDSSWTPKDISPPFLLHLEKIKMECSKSSALHLEFVDFLLRNTNSVKEITIIPNEFDGGKKNQSEAEEG